MKYEIELTQADDPRRKTAWCDNLQFEQAIPIPNVGDTLACIPGAPQILKVEHRGFSYFDGLVYVQLFCSETDNQLPTEE